MPVTVAEGLIGFVVDLGKVDSGLSALQKGLANMESSFTRIGTKSAIITTALTGIGLLSVKMAGNLETAMKRFELASKASGDQLQKVNDQARELSVSTGKFSSPEIVDAMTAMTKSGVDYATTMQKIGDVVTFAKGTNTDLITSIDLADKVIDLYKDSWSNLNKYLDLFAVTANTTEIPISSLTSILRSAVPIGSAYGLSIQDIITIMVGFTEAGADAGEAGLAFRRMLAFAADDADQLTKKLEGTGLTARDVTIKSFDDLCNVIDKFNEKGISATKIVDLFGAKFGGSYISHLISQGSDALREEAKQFENVGGAAKKAAATYESTFQQSWSNLQANVKDLVIDLGTRLLPSLEKWIMATTEVTQQVRELSPATKDTMTAMSEWASITAILITGLAGMSKFIVWIGSGLGSLGIVGTTAFAWVGLATIAITPLVDILKEYYTILAATRKEMDAWKETQKKWEEMPIEQLSTEIELIRSMRNEFIISKQAYIDTMKFDETMNEKLRREIRLVVEEYDKELSAIQQIIKAKTENAGIYYQIGPVLQGPPPPEGYTPNQPGPSTGGGSLSEEELKRQQEFADGMNQLYADMIEKSKNQRGELTAYFYAQGQIEFNDYIAILTAQRDMYAKYSTEWLTIDQQITDASTAYKIAQLDAYSNAYMSKAQIQFANDTDNYDAQQEMYTNMLDQKLMTQEQYQELMLESANEQYINEFGILTTMYEEGLIATEAYYEELEKLKTRHGATTAKVDANEKKVQLKTEKQYLSQMLNNFSTVLQAISDASNNTNTKMAISFLQMSVSIIEAAASLCSALIAVAIAKATATESSKGLFAIATTAAYVAFATALLTSILSMIRSAKSSRSSSADTGGYFDDSGNFLPLKSGGHFRVNVLPGEMMIPKGMMPEVMDYYGGRTRGGMTIGDINLNISGVTDAGSFRNQIDSIADEVTKAIQRRIYLYQS